MNGPVACSAPVTAAAFNNVRRRGLWLFDDSVMLTPPHAVRLVWVAPRLAPARPFMPLFAGDRGCPDDCHATERQQSKRLLYCARSARERRSPRNGPSCGSSWNDLQSACVTERVTPDPSGWVSAPTGESVWKASATRNPAGRARRS